VGPGTREAVRDETGATGEAVGLDADGDWVVAGGFVAAGDGSDCTPGLVFPDPDNIGRPTKYTAAATMSRTTTPAMSRIALNVGFSPAEDSVTGAIPAGLGSETGVADFDFCGVSGLADWSDPIGWGTATDPALVPHDSQNFVPGISGAPQVPHTGCDSIFAPQDSQNFMPDCTGLPHFGHSMGAFSEGLAMSIHQEEFSALTMNGHRIFYGLRFVRVYSSGNR
jgi:hypothetical protein